jgi:hypothetical protein
LLSGSQTAQEGHHRTPVSKGRLNQIDRYESGEQEPIGTVKIAEQHCAQHKAAGDQAEISFNCHDGNSLSVRSSAKTIPMTIAWKIDLSYNFSVAELRNYGNKSAGFCPATLPAT